MSILPFPFLSSALWSITRHATRFYVWMYLFSFEIKSVFTLWLVSRRVVCFILLWLHRLPPDQRASDAGG